LRSCLRLLPFPPVQRIRLDMHLRRIDKFQIEMRPRRSCHGWIDGRRGNGDFVDGSAILTIVIVNITITVAIVLRSRGRSGGGRVVRRPAMADGPVKTPSQFFRLFGGAQGTLISSYSNFGVYFASLDGVGDFLVGVV